MEKEFDIKKIIKEASDEAAEKATKRTRDYSDILIEDMRSDFRMFGEALSGLGNKVDRVENRLDGVEQEIKTLGDRVSMVEVKVDSINDKLDSTFEETGRLKTEKADNERVDKIDFRLAGVEKQLA
ncbi:hypothetical protein ACFL05_00655 [Patescibacteria group bacterium]